MGRIHSLRLPTDHRPCPLPQKNWRPYLLGCFEVEERLLILPRLDTLSGLAPEPERRLISISVCLIGWIFVSGKALAAGSTHKTGD